MIYLATPYNHADPAVRQERFERVNAIAARLMSEGKHVFSPISQCHPICLAGGLPPGWEYWEAYDRIMLSVCDTLMVVMAPGWMESVGVGAEIKIAQELGLRIEYIAAE
jgi:hypothetical protein